MAIQIRTSLAEPEATEGFVPHRPARPEKHEGGKAFKIVSEFEPSGDQPLAIKELTEAAAEGERSQVLLGVTGSGKTFTMAKVIETLQRPALVIAPNKILAGYTPHGKHLHPPGVKECPFAQGTEAVM